MADDLAARLERAAERILEDERLYANLTDAEARLLVDWALGRLDALARKGLDVDAATDRVRSAMRSIGDLSELRQGGSAPALAERLRQLALAWQPAGRPDRQRTAALAGRLAGMPAPAWVGAVLAFLDTLDSPGGQVR